MRIAFVTKERMSYDEAPPSRILNLKKIIQARQDVFIFCRGTQIVDDRIIVIPHHGDNFIGNQLYKICMLLRVMLFSARTRLDVIITREWYYLILLYPFTRLQRIRMIYDMHCYRHKELLVEGKRLKSMIVAPLETLSHKLADDLMAVSQGLIDDLPLKIRKKAFLVSNGVDLDGFSDKIDPALLKRYDIPASFLVGFVGNWMEWVDVDCLLEASRKLRKGIKVIIIGKCYGDMELDSLKKRYPEVIFTGRIPHHEVLQFLSRIDLAILPYKKVNVLKHLSVRKTFEYLAAGKPLVMSRSDMNEREFLIEEKNAIYYEPEDSADLARAIEELAGDRRKLASMARANRRLAKSFSWENAVKGSLLSKIMHLTPPKKGKVSIVIKALNEERNIGECIESALDAIKGIDGEVILVDSLSSDKTVEIASRYPIRIIQLNDPKDRCCGIGPELGFLYSEGEFIYILDGDMKLDRGFIKKALRFFKDLKVGGVGGNINELSRENLAFQVRSKNHVVDNVVQVHQLGMGGLYRRKALEEIGHFSNPWFYAYEEYELGAKLEQQGYNILRIPIKMIDHHGDETTSFGTVIGRWKSKYLLGSGQYLRTALADGHLLRTAIELKIYILTLAWAVIGLVTAGLSLKDTRLISAYAMVSLLFLGILLSRKRNINKTIFSIFSWTSQALGMLIGFIIGAKLPERFRPDVRVIKDG